MFMMRSKHKVILAAIALIALVAGAFWYFSNANTGIPESEYEPDDVTEYFTTQTQDAMRAELGQPIEGYEEMMFLATYPGLTEADFAGVETFGDANGDMQTSADASITDAGMAELLTNVADRAGIDVESRADVDAVIEFMETDPQNGAPENDKNDGNDGDDDGPQAARGCFVSGCSSQLCTDDPNIASTCEYREEYACYRTATCERQADGQCGWTETEELRMCLNAAA